MPLAVIGLTAGKHNHAALDGLVDDESLLLLLEGPDRRVGAAWVDPAFVGGLIQQQTMGKVLAAPEGKPRVMTPTDAAMCAPLLDELFLRAAVLPETKAERDLLAGYRFGVHADEKRVLLMALEEPEYEVLTLTLDMASGARQGKMVLCLPPAQAVAAPVAPPPEGEATPCPSGATLENTVLELRVDLTVALKRLRMPISAVTELAVGDVVPLGIDSLDEAVVLTTSGRLLGRGALGQINGMRALRLEHDGRNHSHLQRRTSDRAMVPDGGYEPMAGDPLEAGMGALMDMPDMPDMSDLPGLEEMPDMADLPGLSGDLPELADLPDMGDLPKINIG